jgi:hypothetical protein
MLCIFSISFSQARESNPQIQSGTGVPHSKVQHPSLPLPWKQSPIRGMMTMRGPGCAEALNDVTMSEGEYYSSN